MNKKILIGIGIFVVIIAMLVGIYFIYVYKPSIQAKKQLTGRFSEFKIKYDEKKAQGYDVTEAEEFAKKAKQAFDRKDYKKANKLLDKAFKALERAIPETVKEEAKERLSSVEVASFYLRVTDGMRSIDDVINLLKETKTDFLFLGWLRDRPYPESCLDLPPEQASICEEYGLSYEHFRDAVNKIKREKPDLIFTGGVAVEFLYKKERNPMTGEIFEQEETWEMALDPSKWGIDMTKEEFQCGFAKTVGWISPEGKCPNVYDPKKVPAYFPDITNPKFQELFLSWAKKQIDCGVDAIWIDMLFSQAVMLAKITGNPSHPAVKESFDAACEIVNEIHSYGYSKGKYIYVGSWAGFVHFPYPPPDLDFVTLTPSSKEVYSMELDEDKWDTMVKEIREKLGDIPIFAFIDFGTETSPMVFFSQKLSPDKQKDFLRKMDTFFQGKGINFIYPLHGGWMGNNAKILSLGRYKVYDSLASEFQTYETIKELAQEKSKIKVKNE